MKRISFILMFVVLSIAGIVAQEYAEVYVICENHLKAKFTECLEYDIVINGVTLPRVEPNNGVCVKVSAGTLDIQAAVVTTKDMPPMKFFKMRGLTSFSNHKVIQKHPAKRQYQHNIVVRNGEKYILILETIKNKTILEQDVLAHEFNIIPEKKHKQIEKKIEKGKINIVETYELSE